MYGMLCSRELSCRLPVDHIYTHLNQEEDLSTLTGKLQDDLVRSRNIFIHYSARRIIPGTQNDGTHQGPWLSGCMCHILR